MYNVTQQPVNARSGIAGQDAVGALLRGTCGDGSAAVVARALSLEGWGPHPIPLETAAEQVSAIRVARLLVSTPK